VLKISIISAVYNNSEHLEACFSSVFSQSYPNIEYIVVDGGSTDGSVDIIRKYEHKISQWISEPDRGIYDALNKGIAMASGDVIGFLHSDDLFNSSGTIQNIAETFEKTDCDATYGNLEYVSRNNPGQVIRFWKSSPFKFELLKTGWMPPHPTLFVKRKWYGEKGTFRTDFRISADYDLILRLFSDSRFKSSYIDQVITRMRTGGASNRSLKNIYVKSKEDYIALRQTKVGGFGTLFLKNAQKILQFVKRT
jgi:glycosyltransferase